jgi:peroxiredoxin
MKKIFFFFFVIVSIKSFSQQADDRGYFVKVGGKAPRDFVLKCTDGTTHTLNDLRGKVILLQFTASWCSVCRKEMPHLEKDIWEKYKNKGLVMIGVDRNEAMDTVQQFAKDMKITYPLALDPNADIFGKFADKNAGVTRNVLIDKDGTIVFLTRLYNKEEFNELQEKVAALFQ